MSIFSLARSSPKGEGIRALPKQLEAYSSENCSTDQHKYRSRSALTSLNFLPQRTRTVSHSLNPFSQISATRTTKSFTIITLFAFLLSVSAKTVLTKKSIKEHVSSACASIACTCDVMEQDALDGMGRAGGYGQEQGPDYEIGDAESFNGVLQGCAAEYPDELCQVTAEDFDRDFCKLNCI